MWEHGLDWSSLGEGQVANTCKSSNEPTHLIAGNFLSN
jgi:hypothetical protein